MILSRLLRIKMSGEIQNHMSVQSEYGKSKNAPCRYLGLNVDEEDDEITININHYIENLEAANISDISSLKRNDILPEIFLQVFRSLASMLNMLATSARTDLMYDAKI